MLRQMDRPSPAHLLVDAGPAVGNCQDECAAGGWIAPLDGCLEDDAPASRELDGVGQQVVEHLPQKAGIGAPGSGKPLTDAQEQLIAASPGGGRMADQNLFEQIDAIQAGPLDDDRPVPAGAMLAKGLDQAAQLPPGLLNRFQPVFLFGREPGIPNQPGHAKQAVHHVADFVIQFGHGPRRRGF
jgi:hypothetical protein